VWAARGEEKVQHVQRGPGHCFSLKLNVFNHPALRSSLSPCQTALFPLLHRVHRRAAHSLVPPLYQDRKERRRGLARRMVSKCLCHVSICLVLFSREKGIFLAIRRAWPSMGLQYMPKLKFISVAVLVTGIQSEVSSSSS
jgi:hypothetical protein